MCIRDRLFGYDGDPAQRNIYGLLGANPQLAKDGIALRRYGQQIIEWLGKKRIHPAWLVPVSYTHLDVYKRQLLAYLSTDRWALRFVEGGILPQPDRQPEHPSEDCVVLLSGGLDSYIGAIDLAAQGKRPLAVSQMVRGDGEKQMCIRDSL